VFEKTERIDNPELRKKYHSMRCVVCRKTPCDPDHISTKGSGGDDSEHNMWALCRNHHQERHQLGIASFISKYERAYEWLVLNNREDVLSRIEYQARTDRNHKL
jgi:hypothetical protein